jgi:riboflavin synthase
MIPAMFSGIIETTGRVVRANRSGEGNLWLDIEAKGLAEWPGHGASICVSGCCLTVARLEPQEGVLGFDVIPESLDRTWLGRLKPGDSVNLEPSVRPTTRLDGHVVQGHVEGLGTVVSVRTEGEWRVEIEAPEALMPCVVPKGSVAVDGVSLTLAAVRVPQRRFEVALIPTTLELTTLGELKVGSTVHLETDVMARTVVHWLTHYGAGVSGR